MSSMWNSKDFFSPGFHAIVSAPNQFRLYSLFLLLFALACLSSTAIAQRATVVGTVTDQSGTEMPAVKISITNSESTAVKTIQTNDAGQSVVPNLTVGH